MPTRSTISSASMHQVLERGLWSAAASIDDDCRAVHVDFRCAACDRRGREPYVEHRIGAQLLCLLDHALDGLRTALLEQLRVAFELAAENVLERRHDVPARMLRTNRAAVHQTEMLNNRFVG